MATAGRRPDRRWLVDGCRVAPSGPTRNEAVLTDGESVVTALREAGASGYCQSSALTARRGHADCYTSFNLGENDVREN